MSIEMQGLSELQSAIGGFSGPGGTDPVRKIVSHHGSALEKKMKEEAVFVKGYSRGDTREGIHMTLSDGGMTTTVGPRTSYSPYVEWGTRYMSAQPFVGPAFNAEKPLFLHDLDLLVR